MSPEPSKLEPRLVPSTEWVRLEFIDGRPVETAKGGVFIEPNIDTECFSIRSVDGSGNEDLIHFCDWPELRATIDQFMADRAKEASADAEV